MATTSATMTECPQCGKKGKTVRPSTLRALLKEEHASAVAAANESVCVSSCQPSLGDTGWRFCGTSDCDVVYFSEQNGAAITKDQLTIPVGVKERAGERPLCYCFGHSVATITGELRAKGRSDALENIRRQMKDLGCACEVKNPSGSCCLGTVAQGIETAKAELQLNTSAGNKAEAMTKMGMVL